MLAGQVKMILILLLISCIAGCCYFVFLKIQRRPIQVIIFLRNWLFFTYLMGIVSLTIFPLPGPNNFLAPDEPHYILVPFNFLRRIYSYLLASPPWTFSPPIIGLIFDDTVMQPVLNILLFVPLGFYLKYYIKWTTLRVLLTVFIFSLIIELLQLTGLMFLYDRPYRLFEVDDLLTNTVGGLGGIWLSHYLVTKRDASNVIN